MLYWPKYLPYLESCHIHDSIIANENCKSPVCWLWHCFGVETNQFRRVVNRLYELERNVMHDPTKVGHLTAVTLWPDRVSKSRVAARLNRVFNQLGYDTIVYIPDRKRDWSK